MRTRRKLVRGSMIAVAMVAAGAVGLSSFAAAVPDGANEERDPTAAELTELKPIPDRDIRTFANAKGVSFEDARWLIFEGGGGAIAFIEEHQDSPDFGAIRASAIDGRMVFELRLTKENSMLTERFTSLTGREPLVRVGGQSDAEMRRDMKIASEQLGSGADTIPASIVQDFDAGGIVVEVAAADVAAARGKLDVGSIEVRGTAGFEIEVPASYAGVNLTTCSGGFALKTSIGGRALTTAGHCTDTGQSAHWQGTLGAAFSKTCTTSDRQLHSAPNQVYHGFFDWAGNWQNVYALGYGGFQGQVFYRMGMNGDAFGTRGANETRTHRASGDCTFAYNVFGWQLHNTSGGPSAAGDSGGAVLLAYNGYWYASAQTTSEGKATHDGFSAFRSIPTNWTVCTWTTPCTPWP